MDLGTKKKWSDIAIRLTDDLSQMILKKRQDFYRVINFELLTLFWNIGIKLNDQFKKAGTERRNILDLSNALKKDYGPSFNAKNLNKFREFATQFYDRKSIQTFSPFLTWQHISLLLEIENATERLLYFRLSIEKGQSLYELRKTISDRAISKSKLPKGIQKRDNRQESLDDVLNSMNFISNHIQRNEVLQTHFERSFKLYLQPLFTSSKRVRFSENTKNAQTNKGTYQEISMLINEFCDNQSRWINRHLNMLLWEMGNKISTDLSLNKEATQKNKSILQHTSKILRRRFWAGLSYKNLLGIDKVAAEFSDMRVRLAVFKLTTWSHLLLLAELHEPEQQLFYARLCAKEDLSVNSLRRAIASKTFEKTPDAGTSERVLIARMQNPKTKTRVKKEGSNLVIIDTTYGEMIDSTSTTHHFNVLKNPFMSLLTSHDN